MPLYCAQGHENQIGSRFCLQCGEPLASCGHILETVSHCEPVRAGGFGRTYLAEDLHRFNERCVLNLLPKFAIASCKKAKELFEREAVSSISFTTSGAKISFFEAKLGRSRLPVLSTRLHRGSNLTRQLSLWGA